MGAPKTQTVGGGTATPVANSWNQFLQGQLYQQPGTQSVPQTAAGPMQGQGNPPPILPSGVPGADSINRANQRNWAAQQQQMQATSGGPGPFQDLIKGMMNPDIGNMISNNPFLSGAGGFNPYAQLPQSPNVPMSGVNSLTPGKDLLASYGIDVGKLLGEGGGYGGGPTTPYVPGQLKDYSTDPSFQAIQQVAERQKMQDIADLRARYGLMGNTQSSGSSLAEAQYRAEANPRLVAGLGGLGREIQGLDLQLQDLNRRGQATSAASGRGSDIGQNIGNLLQFIQGTRGQDVGALGQDQGALLNLFGQQSSNALQNQNAANNWMQTLFGGGLNLQGMGQQGQMDVLSNLFNSFNQAQQIGTPQAQTVQKPSMISQIAGLAGTVLPFIPGMQPLGIGASLLGGGGSPAMAPPNVRPLGPNYQPTFGIGGRTY